MLSAGAVLPSSPLLVPGLAAARPPALDVIEPYLASLGRCDAVLVLAPATAPLTVGEPGRPGGGSAGCTSTTLLEPPEYVSLAGLGRPDLQRAAAGDAALLRAVRSLGLPSLPGRSALSHAVFTLMLGRGPPVPQVRLAPAAEPEALLRLGCELADILGRDERRLGLLAAGDLAAAHGDRAPLTALEGAADFDRAMVHALREGDTGAAAGAEASATALGAAGWASIVTWIAAVGAAALPPPAVTHLVPHGVGWAVAHTER